MPFDGTQQVFRKPCRRAARKWTFIVFLKDGRSIMSPGGGMRSRKAMVEFLDTKVREINAAARPDSTCRTGCAVYWWRDFSHAIPVPVR
jgi:hypothetical protein